MFLYIVKGLNLFLNYERQSTHESVSIIRHCRSFNYASIVPFANKMLAKIIT